MSDFVELMKQGVAAVQAGNKTQAQQLFLQATELRPDDVRGWWYYARVAPSKPEAVKALQKVLSLEPDHQEAKALLQKLAPGGQAPAGQLDTEKVSTASQAAAARLAKQGAEAVKAGNQEAAQNYFRQAINLKPNDVRLWWYYAQVASSLEQAQEALQKVLSMEPNHQDAKTFLVKVNAKLAQESTLEPEIESEPVLEPETVYEPEPQPDMTMESTGLRYAKLMEQGVKANIRGERENAGDFFMQAIKLNPRNANGWWYYAQIADSDTQMKEALEQVLELDPEHEEARGLLDKVNARLEQAPPHPKTITGELEPEIRDSSPEYGDAVPPRSPDYTPEAGFIFDDEIAEGDDGEDLFAILDSEPDTTESIIDSTAVEVESPEPEAGTSIFDRPPQESVFKEAKEKAQYRRVGRIIMVALLLMIPAYICGVITGLELSGDNNNTPAILPAETEALEITDIPEPTLALTDTPTEVPTETPEPTDIPTEVPTETPEPTDTPTEVPTETPEPTDIPTEAPTETPVEMPESTAESESDTVEIMDEAAISEAVQAVTSAKEAETVVQTWVIQSQFMAELQQKIEETTPDMAAVTSILNRRYEVSSAAEGEFLVSMTVNVNLLCGEEPCPDSTFYDDYPEEAQFSCTARWQLITESGDLIAQDECARTFSARAE